MYGAPQPAAPKSSSSLVLFIVLGVIGVLVVGGIFLVILGIFGVRRYIANAKTTEAIANVSLIASDAQAEFAKPAYGGYAFGSSHRLCRSASQPVPASISQVSGKKYMSSASDWDLDRSTNAGFYCLKFEVFSPQYYQYDYRITGTGSGMGDSFTAEAHGDLDGDGRASTFRVVGTVDGPSTLRLDPLMQTDPSE